MQRQAKYEPLQAHLESVGFDRIRMTFRQIEQVIGSELPGSARKYRAWWSNNPSNSVMTRAWLGAGYMTEGVSMEHEFLTFRKDKSIERPQLPVPGDKAGETHPVFSCMSGTVTIADGTDLTEPASPEWEDAITARGIRRE